MLRRLTMLSVLGLLATGLGCKHIGGKCDCQGNPADAAPLGFSNPYPAAPAPGLSAPGAIPPAANGVTGGGPNTARTLPAVMPR